MIDYEVGQIPAHNLGIVVNDQVGNPLSLVGYQTISIELLDSDNQIANVSDVGLVVDEYALGQVALVWPKNRSLFNKSGKYLLRLVLRRADGSVDPTRPVEIRVRKFGRLN